MLNKNEIIEHIGHIKQILQSKGNSSDMNSNLYAFISKKLNLIESACETEDFSLETKRNCDIGVVLSTLYSGAETLPKLGEELCAIHNSFQNLGAKTLSEEQASEFLSLLKKQ